MKVCSCCGVDKPLDEFHRKRSGSDERRAKCKACHSAKMKQYNAEHSDRDKPKALARYYNNRERRLDGCRAYYQSNRDRKLEYFRERREQDPGINARYYATNGVRVREQNRRYRDQNREKLRLQQRGYRQKNAAAINERVARRKAAKRRATPAWVRKDQLRKPYMLADILTRATGSPWHVDHIVPLVSPLVCGLHCPANLTVIPGAENVRKNNRYWPDMPT